MKGEKLEEIGKTAEINTSLQLDVVLKVSWFECDCGKAVLRCIIAVCERAGEDRVKTAIL